MIVRVKHRRTLPITAFPSLKSLVASTYDPLDTNNWMYHTSAVVIGRRAFASAGPTVWNSLPDNLRDSTVGPDQFQRELKLICLPVCLILRRQCVRGFLRSRAIQIYIYLVLTYLLTYLLTILWLEPKKKKYRITVSPVLIIILHKYTKLQFIYIVNGDVQKVTDVKQEKTWTPICTLTLATCCLSNVFIYLFMMKSYTEYTKYIGVYAKEERKENSINQRQNYDKLLRLS